MTIREGSPSCESIIMTVEPETPAACCMLCVMAKGDATISLRFGGIRMPALLREVFSMAEMTVDMFHQQDNQGA